jgi:hypothetical protein
VERTPHGGPSSAVKIFLRATAILSADVKGYSRLVGVARGEPTLDVGKIFRDRAIGGAAHGNLLP